MNENEENVYSSMGLDPILLLDEVPASENYIVQIIRPGEDKNKILEEARQNIINNSNKKRKKNNKSIIRMQNKNIIEQPSSSSEEDRMIQENEPNLDIIEQSNELILTENIENQASNNPRLEEANEDPRRKRRRSSAST